MDPIRSATPAVQRSPLRGIEYRFGILLAIFGLAFLVCLPPVQAPDEFGHFLHAYDVAQGHLLPGHDTVGLAGVTVPVNLMPIVNRLCRFWDHPEERWTWQDIRELLDLRFTEEETLATLWQLSVYPFVPYLPQAAGIWAAHQLHLPPLPLFYASRLGNLVFGVLCVVLAIRLTPIGKLLFGAIALLPMTVHQIASASADGPTIGVALLLVAVLLRLALASNTSRSSTLLIGLLLLLIFATTLTKPGYTALALVYFGIAPRQIGSRRRYWMIGALVLVATAASFAAYSTLTRPYALDPHWIRGMPISKSGQMHFILTQPHRYLWVFLNAVTWGSWEWTQNLFILGTLSAPMNEITGYTYLFFLALLAVADRGYGELPWRLWLAGSALTLVSFAMILTACYVWWNPQESGMIEGPQGRYFIPLMPLFFLLLRNGGFRVTADERFLARMTLAVTTIFLTYAWATLVNRFYFRDPPRLLAPPALLGLSVAALFLFWIRCRRTPDGTTTEDSAQSPFDGGASSRLAA